MPGYFLVMTNTVSSKCKIQKYEIFWGALRGGAHPWIDPRFGFAPLLNTWTHGCAARFHASIWHFAPTTSVTWHMTSFTKIAKNVVFCYFAIVWATDDMELLQWNILLIVDENKYEPMSSIVYSWIEKAVSFRGCAPAGAKVLDEIGFVLMEAVDRSYRCTPLLYVPLVNATAQ